MVFMHMLRFLIDISFYFSFASVIVTGLFKNHLTIGWLLAMIPAAIYVLLVILNKNYGLSWHRQMDIFTIFWKGYLGFVFVICLVGLHKELLTYSMPFAIVVVCTSILFLRMLRQSPEVYLNREYQNKNILFFIGIILLAWLSSRKWILLPIKYTLKFFYMKVLVPIVTLLAVGLGLLVAGAMKVLSGVLTRMEVDSDKIMSVILGSNEIENKVSHIAKENNLSASVWWMLGSLGIIVAVIILFRWLNQKWKPQVIHSNGAIREVSIEETYVAKGRSFSNVQQVRRQYRKFLKLYQKCGKMVLPCDTSLDITDKSLDILSDTNLLENMRMIYMRARYDNLADASDVRKMKQMYHRLKQKIEKENERYTGSETKSRI